jgi:hypothetical protein
MVGRPVVQALHGDDDGGGLALTIFNSGGYWVWSSGAW